MAIHTFVLTSDSFSYNCNSIYLLCVNWLQRTSLPFSCLFRCVYIIQCKFHMFISFQDHHPLVQHVLPHTTGSSTYEMYIRTSEFVSFKRIQYSTLLASQLILFVSLLYVACLFCKDYICLFPILNFSWTHLITARKRSLRRLCFTRVCLSTRGVVSQHALQVVSQHALQVSRGGCPGPHPGGKLRGVAGGGVFRPTPGGSPGPHLGGSPGPHLGGLQVHTWGVYPSMHWGRPPVNGYRRGRHASYRNTFLFDEFIYEVNYQ